LWSLKFHKHHLSFATIVFNILINDSYVYSLSCPHLISWRHIVALVMLIVSLCSQISFLCMTGMCKTIWHSGRKNCNCQLYWKKTRAVAVNCKNYGHVFSASSSFTSEESCVALYLLSS
jgi:hypothetical protein